MEGVSRARRTHAKISRGAGLTRCGQARDALTVAQEVTWEAGSAGGQVSCGAGAAVVGAWLAIGEVVGGGGEESEAGYAL